MGTNGKRMMEILMSLKQTAPAMRPSIKSIEKGTMIEQGNKMRKAVETANKSGDKIILDIGKKGSAFNLNYDGLDQNARGVIPELNKYFTEIHPDMAEKLFKNNKEVFGLDAQGFESLIQDAEDLKKFPMFVIEKKVK